jgi:hypothetical protein
LTFILATILYGERPSGKPKTFSAIRLSVQLPYNREGRFAVPQFRPKPMLERSATADLFKNTLSRIPTVFGRLAYLTSLRDSNSGIYRHHGLASIFGREESRKALSQSHQIVFQEWLNLPLGEKRGDLSNYLDGLEDPRPEVLQHWTSLRTYRTYMPASARESERELFCVEFDVLLDIFKCPDPPASSRA